MPETRVSSSRPRGRVIQLECRSCIIRRQSVNCARTIKSAEEEEEETEKEKEKKEKKERKKEKEVVGLWEAEAQPCGSESRRPGVSNIGVNSTTRRRVGLIVGYERGNKFGVNHKTIRRTLCAAGWRGSINILYHRNVDERTIARCVSVNACARAFVVRTERSRLVLMEFNLANLHKLRP